MSFLIDTNVISEARKAKGDRHVKAWLASTKGDDLYLSVLVVGEIRRGIELVRRRDAAQAEVYVAWLNQLHDDYADRVLPITAEIAEEWGRLSVPDPVPVIDALMAATAKVHRLTLVTRNVSDLARTGVPLVNPFEYRK